MWTWREQYANCDFIIAGDFNVDLDTSASVACLINSLRTEHNLVRCDDLYPRAKIATYVNNSLNQQELYRLYVSLILLGSNGL